MNKKQRSFVLGVACLCVSLGGTRWVRVDCWVSPDVSGWSAAQIERETWRLTKRMVRQPDLYAWVTALRLSALHEILETRSLENVRLAGH